MKHNRRSFLGTGMAGAAIAVTGGMFTSCCGNAKSGAANGKKAVLNISWQEGIAPGASLAEKFDYMESLGVTGFEPGGRGLANRVDEIKTALQNRNIKVSAICAGFEGWLIADDPAIRQQCMDSMKSILEAAGALGSVGLIFVPAFNRQPSLPDREARELLIEEMKELADFALKHNTRILLEPLNRGECFFCRQVPDGAAIVKDVGSEGAAVMGDFWHMTWEETSDRGAFICAGDYLKHVHIASRKRRKTPGEDGEADNYIDGFRGLKEIGYDGYVSYECGTVGDKQIVLPESVKLLRDQWEQA